MRRGFKAPVTGAAWLVGSAVCGALLDRSVIGLAIFSVALELLAIPVLLRRPENAARTG